MVLSKLLSNVVSASGDVGSNSCRSSWRMLFAVGTPIAVVAGGMAYWKYGKSFGFGNFDSKPKDDNSNEVEYIIEEENSSILTAIKEAKRLKNIGNNLFKGGEFQAALIAYTDAAEVLEIERAKLSEDDVNNKAELLELLQQLYQNCAAVHEKLGEYDRVIHEATLALELNHLYVKALSRRAKAYKTLGFLDEALDDSMLVCLLQKPQLPGDVELLDGLLNEVGIRDANKIMREKRPPFTLSPQKVKIFMQSFHNCPIAKLFKNNSPAEIDKLRNNPCYDTPYNKAVIALMERKYDDIISLCTEEISCSESRFKAEAYYLRGTFYYLYGYKQEVIDDFEQVFKDENVTRKWKSTALITAAISHSLTNEENISEKKLMDSQDIWNENTDLWHQRGQLLLSQGKLVEAISCFSKAVDMEPNFGLVAVMKCFSEYHLSAMQNSNDQSVFHREFARLVERFPDLPQIHSLYAQVLVDRQEFQKADKYFSRALQLDPEDVTLIVHKEMNRCAMTGNVQETVNALENATNIDNKSDFLYITLGTIYLQSGVLDKAVERFNTAIELSSSMNDLHPVCSCKKNAEVQIKLINKLGISQVPSISV